MPSHKNVNQRFREVGMRLNRSEDVPMSRLSIIKSTEEDHDQSNVVCEELKDKLKVTAHPVVTIGKVLQKEGSGK